MGSPCEGAILRGKGRPIVKYMDHHTRLLPSTLVSCAVNRSRCRLGCGLACAQGIMGCTLPPPGECDWTVHVRRRCGFRSIYFDRLLLLSLLQILQAKVQRLERLVSLKDIRVKDLQTRLQQLQDAEADNSPADRPRIIHRWTQNNSTTVCRPYTRFLFMRWRTFHSKTIVPDEKKSDIFCTFHTQWL